MPRSKRPTRKYRNTAETTAMKLFGLPPMHKMESLDQRVEIAGVLALSDRQDFKDLSRAALDPLNSGVSFARLAEKSGLNFHMISSEYRAIKVDEGYVRAARHLPDLMEQVAVDAKSRDERCRTCKGTGKLDEDKPCPTCDGLGTVYVLGNAERLKLIFETFQLTGKGGGVAVNLDLRKVAASETLEDLASTMGKVLEGETND